MRILRGFRCLVKSVVVRGEAVSDVPSQPLMESAVICPVKMR
jgi:hypothetical protein